MRSSPWGDPVLIREPSVAGTFYPDDRDRCMKELDACIASARKRAARDDTPELPERIHGCIMPHAGWQFSGATAARSLLAVCERDLPQVVIVFGAIHIPHGKQPTCFDRGGWETPLGILEVEQRLCERLMGQTGLLQADPHAHEGEHSIEVELPFIQQLLGDIPFVPIMVQPDEQAAALGRSIGRTCRAYGVRALFICSTDLTHYGPRFDFAPEGVGPDGLQWARDINDKRMINLIRTMEAEHVVDEALHNRNACGAGALAATIEACQACGAQTATLLEHRTSEDAAVELGLAPSQDAVGYASMVIG